MDWSALPPELLRLISKKLLIISEFVRFRAVCQQWRQSALTSDAAPQLPWLVERLRLSEFGEANCQNYCFASGTTHTVRIDKCDKSKRFLHLSCIGYYLLAIGGDGSLCLINVFANKEIPLPALDVDLINPRPVSHNQGKDLVVIETINDCESSVVRFCRLEEKSWRKTELRMKRVYYYSYYNGSCLFLQNCYDAVTIVDAVTGSILFKVPFCVPVGHDRYPYHPSLMHAVHESFGKTLAIFVLLDDFYNVKGFEVSQLVLQDDLSGAQLVKMSNIGENIALFFDYSNVFSARAREFPGLKGNSVYFPYDFWVDEYLPCPDGKWCARHTMNAVLGRYDFEERTIEKIGPSFEGSYSWIMPNLC